MPPSTALPRYSDEHHPRQLDEVAPARPPPVRRHEDEHDRDQDQPGEQAVELLDRLVLRADADEVVGVAVRPVGAAEPRVGEPDDRAAHDDDREQDEVHQREATERARRQLGNAHRRQCTRRASAIRNRTVGTPSAMRRRTLVRRSSRSLGRAWSPAGVLLWIAGDDSESDSVTSPRNADPRRPRRPIDDGDHDAPPSRRPRRPRRPAGQRAAGDVRVRRRHPLRRRAARQARTRTRAAVLAPIAPRAAARRPRGRATSRPRSPNAATRHRRSSRSVRRASALTALASAVVSTSRAWPTTTAWTSAPSGSRTRWPRATSVRLPVDRHRPQRGRGVRAVPHDDQGPAHRGHRRDAGARRQPHRGVDRNRHAGGPRVGQGRPAARRRGGRGACRRATPSSCSCTGASRRRRVRAPIQQQLARALVDAGADIVVGGHAHRLAGRRAAGRRVRRLRPRQLRVLHAGRSRRGERRAHRHRDRARHRHVRVRARRDQRRRAAAARRRGAAAAVARVERAARLHRASRPEVDYRPCTTTSSGCSARTPRNSASRGAATRRSTRVEVDVGDGPALSALVWGDGDARARAAARRRAERAHLGHRRARARPSARRARPPRPRALVAPRRPRRTGRPRTPVAVEARGARARARRARRRRHVARRARRRSRSPTARPTSSASSCSST